MAGKFYRLHTSSVTPEEVVVALEENPHCVILEGPSRPIKWTIREHEEYIKTKIASHYSEAMRAKMPKGEDPNPKEPLKRPEGEDLISEDPLERIDIHVHEFLMKGVTFTRVGISGTEMVRDKTTGFNMIVDRFHRAISDDDLKSIVCAQGIQCFGPSCAESLQACFC
jgi:hypothetical protein